MSVSRVSSRVPVTRRGVMHGLLVSAAAAVLAPVVAASWPPHRPGSDDVSFDEVYHGRHILGARTGAGGRAAVGGGEWQVTVDGRPLHLMRRADGSYLSMVDHYQSYPTALAAARAAVDELGPSEQLRGVEAEGSGHHGVHA
ncbi:tyrosinase family oxidase copper chaperone [Streptomyces sp. NPDC051639]|uniref:tyrosinase family oxidase copper chaperone n=1 Tax=Streptomyces sp. NPDC051639 TaxID=3155671 RepID=UPI003414B132